MCTRVCLLPVALAVALMAELAPAGADAPKDGPVVVPGGEGARYWLQLPATLDPAKRHPVLLFFHGRGRGVRTEDTNFNVPEFTHFRELCRARGYIVCAVAGLTNMWMNAHARELTDRCLAHVKATLPVDESRIFTAGVSMGGGAALTYAMHRPGVVRAVCDFMGCTDFARFYTEGFYHESLEGAFGGTPAQQAQVYAEQSAALHPEAFAKIPVLIIHGDRDTVVPTWNAPLLWAGLAPLHNGCELLMVHGLGHTNEIVIGLEEHILDFFERAVAPAGCEAR
jgi:dipeptidyl aminopeptidase/acylaminoacyl peptidase